MGATNKIQDTNIRITELTCPQCQQPFTEQDQADHNWEVWFDTTNDVKLTPMAELKNDSYYKPFGRTGYELTIWIRSIEHEICPDDRQEILKPYDN